MQVKKIDFRTRIKSNNPFIGKNWYNQFLSFISGDLVWILAITAIFRLFYYFLVENTEFFDSISYLNYNANIFLGEVNDLRTPLYPYFIKLIRLFGEQNLIQNIVIAQSIISFFTVILFYNITSSILKNRVTICIATLIYGISPSIINWDKCILTESLSISAIVIFISLILSYLHKPTHFKANLFTLYIFIMIMLRPSFIILLPITMLFWLLRLLFYRADWKKCISGFAASLVCILLIMGYSNLNFKSNGSKSISVVSNNNFLDIIIKNNMYLNGNDPAVSETIAIKLAEQNGTWDYDLLLELYAQFSHEKMSKFIMSCFINQPVTYIKRTFNTVINLKNSKISAFYAKRKDGYKGFLINMISPLISIPFMAIYLLLIFDFFYIMMRWLKFKNIPWFKTILWFIVIAQLAITFLGAQDEYQRLIVLALPLILLVAFTYIDILFCSIDKVKIKEYEHSY